MKHKTFTDPQEGVRKDVEQAFGVLISRLHILTKLCMFHDRTMSKMVTEAAIIMHKMFIELRRDGYDSKLFEETKQAAERGMLIGEQGEKKKFRCGTRVNVEWNDIVRDMDWTKRTHKALQSRNQRAWTLLVKERLDQAQLDLIRHTLATGKNARAAFAEQGGLSAKQRSANVAPKRSEGELGAKGGGVEHQSFQVRMINYLRLLAVRRLMVIVGAVQAKKGQ